MTKNELIQYPFNEILKLAKTKDFLKQKIDNQSVFSIMLKSYSTEKIMKIVEMHPTIINEKNEDLIYYVEALINMGKNEILESVSANINLLLKSSNSHTNILGYLCKKGLSNVLSKALEVQPNALNEKDSSGCYGTERLVDAGMVNTLLNYADKIDLLKKSYSGDKNMLGYLCKKGLNNILSKALEVQPNVLNEKDPSGCYGTERLVDAGMVNTLLNYANKIDLLKKSYSGDKNMLGYLCKKGLSNIVSKSLEVQPNALNEKDPSGCYGTERLVDAGMVNTLLNYAKQIDLLKKSYSGDKNMLGYLSEKGLQDVLSKALEVQPNVLNEKDPSGCYGTERLVDAGMVNTLLNYANQIDLLKKDYGNTKNMLGYLCKKGLTNVLSKALETNNIALNEKDPYGCYGTERLADAGFITLINQLSHKIDWSKKATNEQSIFQYIIKKSNTQSEEICIKALIKTPSIINKEMKFIIDSGLTKTITSKEIINQIDKNIIIGNINLLGYLTSKGQEKYVDLLLNPEKSKNYFDTPNANTATIKKEEKVQELNKEDTLLVIKAVKEMPFKIKEEVKESEVKPTNSVKLKIKSML